MNNIPDLIERLLNKRANSGAERLMEEAAAALKSQQEEFIRMECAWRNSESWYRGERLDADPFDADPWRYLNE